MRHKILLSAAKPVFATGLALGLTVSVGTGLSGCTNQDLNAVLDTVATGAGIYAGGSGATQAEMVQGIKQALADGTERAVLNLGRFDGFWQSAAKIAVPDDLQRAADAMRAVGAGRFVDEFELTMNRAAEQAVPEVATILSGAVQNLTVRDAIDIVRGSDNAATAYFQRTTSDALFSRIRPIVSSATARTGATQEYKNFRAKAGPYLALAGREAPDLDTYVTNEAMDALFVQIAEQEKLIRENPAARTSEILRKVFGAS